MAIAGARFASNRTRVVAQYICRGVDVVALHHRMTKQWPDAKLVLDRDWVIALISREAYSSGGDRTDQAKDAGELLAGAARPETCPVFLSVSRRGSIVAVNVPAGERYDRNPRFSPAALIAAVPHTPLPGDAPLASEELGVRYVDRPSLSDGHHFGFRDGELEVPGLDLDSVRVLNSCCAQTVNLQFFEGQVEGMHDTVRDIHADIESGAGSRVSVVSELAEVFGTGGSRHGMSTGRLYRQLAAVNAISNQIVLSGLRNTVRPGSTAWKGERYSELQELLWEELDLDDRYDELQRKLDFVNETIQYSLDMAKNAKGIFLERVIVLLITLELMVSLLHMGVVEGTVTAVQDAVSGVTSQFAGAEAPERR